MERGVLTSFFLKINLIEPASKNYPREKPDFKNDNLTPKTRKKE